MRVAEVWILALLVLLPLLHRWWAQRNKPARVRFSVPLPASFSSFNPLKWLILLKYLGIALIIFSLARPQNSFKQTERTVSGIDIIMLMDFSASMNIEDMGDRSRFELAKDTMEGFIKGRQNDRIGLVIFSGEAITLAPPTLDYPLVMKALKDAQIGILKDGTAIGDGLALAVNRLKNSKAKSRVVVLLTDGDNNVGQIDPATAGELAAGYGIKVYTIAIGKEGRVKMPIRRQGAFGNAVTSYQWFDNALNPQLLQQIAKETDGRFYRVEDEGTLDRVFKEIDQLEKTDVKSSEKVKYEENYQKPLKWGAALLILEKILSSGVWRVLP
ncbi:MAG: VWA domain-containing protein [Methylotenera sp.]|nr:VWA domain-containing protein [Oligoflexia bacterium]